MQRIVFVTESEGHEMRPWLARYDRVYFLAAQAGLGPPTSLLFGDERVASFSERINGNAADDRDYGAVTEVTA